MTQPSTKLHPMLAAQVRNADMKATQIKAVAAHLADLMNQMHGDIDGFGPGWEANVSHDAGAEFVLIKPRNTKGKAHG